MKTKIIMTVMGFFFALVNLSYAGSFSGNKPDCCQKQETCCSSNEACCNGNKVSKTADCCGTEEVCCNTDSACCSELTSNKQTSNVKVCHDKSEQKKEKVACCN